VETRQLRQLLVAAKVWTLDDVAAAASLFVFFMSASQSATSRDSSSSCSVWLILSDIGQRSFQFKQDTSDGVFLLAYQQAYAMRLLQRVCVQS